MEISGQKYQNRLIRCDKGQEASKGLCCFYDFKCWSEINVKLKLAKRLEYLTIHSMRIADTFTSNIYIKKLN